MIRTLVIIFLGLAALREAPAQAAKTTLVNFAPGGVIKFDKSYGDLYVEGWDRPEVGITAATKDSEGLLTEHHSDKEFSISVARPRRGVTPEFEIRVPRDSKLAIHHGNGYVLVTEVAGDIEASNGRGDIVLMVPESQKYSVDAKVKFGNVMSDVAGASHSRYLIGQQFATPADAPHHLNLRMGYGGITIKTVPQVAQLAQLAR